MHKYAHLDSLRWMAAFSVGICHAFQCFYSNEEYLKLPHFAGTMLFNGAYAVDFFFVLSGFVLVNATKSLNLRTYVGFVVRRILRIYPAAWVSVIISGGAFLFAANAYGSPWIAFWAVGLLQWPGSTLQAWIGEFSLVTHRLNPILWSIAVEMVASVLYPPMIAVMRRSVKFYGLLCFGAILASGVIPGQFDISGTGHFLYMFMIGAALNLLWPGFISRKQGGYLLGLAVFLMLLSRPFGSNTTISDLIATTSAAIIIAVVAFACPQRIQTWLGSSKLLLLGRCSYSYYLVNPAVLIILVRWYPALGIAPPVTGLDYVIYAVVLGGVAAALTTPLAHLLATSVERFSIRAGRRAERAILRPISVPAPNMLVR